MTNMKPQSLTRHTGILRIAKELSLRNLVQCCLVVASILMSTSICSASATNVYLAQNSAGGGNGADCADALPVSWFNNSANWGSGATQIGPGTTVHLCGTISSALTFQGSGSSTSPVTLLFENGAQMSAPNWGSGGGAINSSGNGYLIVDGGTNGVIHATSNGTGLATQYDNTGVGLSACAGCIVRNLTVANMYVHTCTEPVSNCTDENGQNSSGIYVSDGSNVSIHNNTVYGAKWCLFYTVGTTQSSVSIYGNTVYNCDHGAAVGGEGSASVSGIQVYSNVIHDGQNWDDAANNNHHDGIHFWTGSGSFSGVQEYNNYMYGDWGNNFNSFLFAEGTQTGAQYFNNVLIDQSSVSHNGCGYICLENNSPVIANNTIVGPGTAINVSYNSGNVVENNTISNAYRATQVASQADIAVWDYNNYYNLGTCGWNCGTFASWQSGGNDAHGSNTNPNLSGTYTPTSSSTALMQGANLASLGISQLDLDKAGVCRPSSSCTSPGTSTSLAISASSPWTIGAYQLNSGTTANTPNPPTGLIASVQ